MNLKIPPSVSSHNKNLLLLYGADTFSLRSLLREWKKAFFAKHGEMNFSELESLSGAEILDAARQTPFLSEKRLIFLGNFLRDAEEEEQKKLAAALVKIPAETVLVFWEEKIPDQRCTLFKKLKQQGRLEVFAAKKGAALTDWLQKQFSRHGQTVTTELCQHLALTAGHSDLWSLQNEVAKICLYCDEGEVNKKTIELLVQPKPQTTIFDLCDNLGIQNHRLQITLLHNLIARGTEPMLIFHMIARQVRLLTLAFFLAKQGESPWNAATLLKVKPFVANNLWRQAKNFDFATLRKLYAQLARIDIAVKTGRLRADGEHGKELVFALERVILGEG